MVTPILVMLASQVVPDRTGRGGDDFVTIAMAATETTEHDTARSPTGRAYIVPLSELGVDVTLIDVAAAPAARQPHPTRPVLWYQVAAAEHGVSPYVLEALHQVETGAAPDGCWMNIEDSGATGPFQFKQATFRRHGLDGNHDGVTDICAFTDSLVSAANYLHVLGARQHRRQRGHAAGAQAVWHRCQPRRRPRPILRPRRNAQF